MFQRVACIANTAVARVVLAWGKQARSGIQTLLQLGLDILYLRLDHRDLTRHCDLTTAAAAESVGDATAIIVKT